MPEQLMKAAPQQLSVLGLPVNLLDNYPDWVIARLHKRMGAHLITLNAEMTMQAEKNPALARVIRQSELVIPDGSGIVLYLWLKGKRVQRCPGIELAEALLQQAGEKGKSWPFFFFGGAPEVAADAAAKWQQKVPELAIAGTQHGYLSSEEEERQLQQTLKELQPRLIFVGLGVPRQELWIAKNRHLCPQAIWIGVGGSFDIWSGTKSRAPAWLRNLHLEWLYRLYQEPWRWRRMLALPLFAWRVLWSSFA